MSQLITLKRLLMLVLFGLLIIFFGLGFNKYLSFTAIREHHTFLLSWTHAHFLFSVLLFISCYTLAVAISVPGAVFLTLVGGFLFGIWIGVVLVVLSATLGSTILFFAIRTMLREWLAKNTSGWVESMRLGFQRNAFSYLLTLRLIPLFPFWVVNIVPALLNVDARIFILATLIGIIPGSLVYVLVGNSLSQLLATNQTPNLAIIFEPGILGALLALAVLSLLPTVYQFFKSKRKDDNHEQNNTL